MQPLARRRVRHAEGVGAALARVELVAPQQVVYRDDTGTADDLVKVVEGPRREEMKDVTLLLDLLEVGGALRGGPGLNPEGPRRGVDPRLDVPRDLAQDPVGAVVDQGHADRR